MHHYVIILAFFMYFSVVCEENSNEFAIEHAGGVFDDSQQAIRVQIRVEEPILVNDVVRMQAIDDTSDFNCTDYFRYCNATGQFIDPLRIQCSCDPDCDLFGNCCWDAPIVEPRPKEANCFALQSTNQIGAYMVDRCPKMSFELDEIRSLCESDNTSRGDPFAWLPISSRTRTYKNIYCAMCHREDIEELLPWTFDISQCSEMTFKNCSIPLNVPNNLTLMPCDRETISSCPEGNEPDRKNCDLYYAPVKDIDTFETYKNKFCAFCRGVLDISCVQPPYTSSGNPTYTRGSSYSIIFDIDFWHGNAFVGSVESCDDSKQEIPSCREVKCEKNNCVLEVSDTKSILTSSCSKWTLDGIEYILDQNGGLRLFNESTKSNSSCIFNLTFSHDQEILTIVCIAISITCLTIKIVFDLFVETTSKKVSQKTILMLCGSLLSAQFLFVVASKRTEWGVFCIIIGLLIHYFFLASFFWTNILAFDIWRTFSTMANTVAMSPSKRFLHYNLYCWFFPFLIVSLAMCFQWIFPIQSLQPGYGMNFCWISMKLPLMVFFVCPLAAILGVNMVLFLWTAFRIWSAVRAARVARETVGQDKVRFLLYFKLAFIMGLTWMFGFASVFIDSGVMWCLFVVFNGLQGAFLLLAFTRFRLKSYFMRLRMFVRKATQATSSRSTKSSHEYSTSKM